MVAMDLKLKNRAMDPLPPISKYTKELSGTQNSATQHSFKKTAPWAFTSMHQLSTKIVHIHWKYKLLYTFDRFIQQWSFQDHF